MLRPTREALMSAFGRDRVVPLRKRIPADLETRVSQVGRHSFVGVYPHPSHGTRSTS